jgi:hypothetical protein
MLSGLFVDELRLRRERPAAVAVVLSRHWTTTEFVSDEFTGDV